jgi:ribosomal protein S18 acetylase RimI-like enzyme
MSALEFRQAVQADLPAICIIGNEVNALHHAAHPEVFAAPSSPERDLEHWRQGCFGEDRVAFVATIDRAVVGYVNASVVNENSTLLQPVRFARVGTIGVHEAHRGQGLGRQLMALVEDWAMTQRATEVRLGVWMFNKAAYDLYTDLGYEARLMTLGKVLNRGPS